MLLLPPRRLEDTKDNVQESSVEDTTLTPTQETPGPKDTDVTSDDFRPKFRPKRVTTSPPAARVGEIEWISGAPKSWKARFLSSN